MIFQVVKQLLANNLFLFFCISLVSFNSVKAQTNETGLSPSSVTAEQSMHANLELTDSTEFSEKFIERTLNSSSIYGPITKNEGLWDIADKLRHDQDVTIVQMAVAIFKYNPKAFLDKNINGLLIGTTLRIPEKELVLVISPQDADTTFQQHWQRWQARQQGQKNAVIGTANTNEEDASTLLENTQLSKLIEIVREAPVLSVISPETVIFDTEREFQHEVAVETTAEQTTAEQITAEQITAEQITAEQITAEQITAEQITTEQITTEQITTEQITTEQITTEQITTVNAALDEKPVETVKEDITSPSILSASTETRTETSGITQDNAQEYVVVNYFAKLEVQSVINKFIQDSYRSINLLWHKIKSTGLHNLEQKGLSGSPELIMLLVFLTFFMFVFLLKKQEVSYVQVDPSTSENELAQESSLTSINTNRSSIPTLRSSLATPIAEQTKDYKEEFHIEVDTISDWETELSSSDIRDGIEQEENKTITVDSASAVPSQVNVQKSIEPGHYKKDMGLLEMAFENNEFLSHGCIGEKQYLAEQEKQSPEEQEKEEEHNISESANLFDSVEEIKFIQEKTRDCKIAAFYELTQPEIDLLTGKEEFSVRAESNIVLESEFDKIKNNEKIEVFIEEFELLVANLTKQAPAIKKEPNEMGYLIEFKLSVHFIKVLSEMMQATQLNHFSQTVIEFLEDIVDGNTRMTRDIIERLVFVVNFYGQYINSVKQNQYI